METVNVAVRIRPMVSSELEKGCQEAVTRILGEPQIVVNNNDAFTFNYVFDAQESQEKLFELSINPMLQQFYSGFNVTILAYGQTGSGKTYTMGTTFNGELDASTGVIPRVMQEIFNKVTELGDRHEVEISCSFLELYQEQLYDLLSEKSREQSIMEIREDKNGIHIPDLTHQVVNSAVETTDCLMRGSSGRMCASTAMNEHSSRSHAIFTVTLKYFKKDEEQQTQITAKLHLVDLAGSERSKKTKATGERFKEGVKINQGLLALGNVISALGSENGQKFVRYRDSKLTRLLQDSLGGNSCTLMIACVSPADYNIQETLSTLRYADRARKIKNKPVVNQDPHAVEINRLKGIIQKLRVDLLASNSGSSSSLDTIPSLAAPSPRKTCNDKMYRELQEKYRNLQKRFQDTLHDVVENEMRAHIAEVAHEKLKTLTDEIKNVAKELAVDVNTEDQQICKEKVLRLIEMFKGLDDELESTVSEMNEHKKLNDLNTSGDHELGEEDGAEIEKEADVYNNKQFRFKEELSRINSQLNIKEQLQHRLAENLTKFCTLDTTASDKFEECQHKIRELEDEKTELMDKLKHVKENASAKLAEERRKRLQILEQELNQMKSKIKQQSSLLKVREKEKVKIDNLHREIQSMKEMKVKLIRSMRQEAENFRQWKMTREKELMQMKNKGRKMENEMARKDALHTKQRNVLKRKCEEAMAINKRLKDALERQSVAQTQRQKSQFSKDSNGKKMDHVIAVIERELEIIMSIIDAEQSLDYLMEDRAVINRRLNELRASGSSNEEQAQLEEEYEMRNAQITELQQKVCAADLESRIRQLCDTAQNMSDARVVFKHLTNAMCEMRRGNAVALNKQKVALDESRSQLHQAVDDHQIAAKRIRTMEKEHQEAVVAIERQYEEKLAVLLNARIAHADGAISVEQDDVQLKIQEELFEKVESMREEICRLNGIIDSSKKVKRMPTVKLDEDIIELSAEDSVDSVSMLEDSDDDPDWRKTPANKRRRTEKSTASNKSRENSENDTFTTAKSQPVLKENTSKTNSRRSCTCRLGCGKRCGCRSDNLKCSYKCRCIDCTNGKVPESESDADDEDIIIKPKNVQNHSNDDIEAKENRNEFLAPPAPITTSPDAKHSDENARRLARLTQINFVTPTSKKKFFD